MSATATRTTEDRIRAVIGFLADADGRFVSVRVVREALAGAADFDTEMIRLYRDGTLNLIPQSAQMALTEADRSAAVRCGGEHKHLVAWIG
jgi:hypothetical protein